MPWEDSADGTPAPPNAYESELDRENLFSDPKYDEYRAKSVHLSFCINSVKKPHTLYWLVL